MRELDQQLHMMPGIVETGFFVGMASVAYFGQKSGEVITAKPKQK